MPLGFSGNDYMVVSMVEDYYKLGQGDKARDLGKRLADQLLISAAFYSRFYDVAQDEFELVGNYIYFLSDEMRKGGDTELAKSLTDNLLSMLGLSSEGEAS